MKAIANRWRRMLRTGSLAPSMLGLIGATMCYGGFRGLQGDRSVSVVVIVAVVFPLSILFAISLGRARPSDVKILTRALFAPTGRRRKGCPPPNAEFLFYLFMTPQNCDAIVGDLEERYKLIHKTFGRRRANFWYWTQTVLSLGPIVWAWTKRVVLKPVLAVVGWAVAKGVVGHDGWLAALV